MTDLKITWTRIARGPRGGGGGIVVLVNGLPGLMLPDSPFSERIARLLATAAKYEKQLQQLVEDETRGAQ